MMEKQKHKSETPRQAVGGHEAQVISLAFYREYKRASCALVREKFRSVMWL